MPKPVVWAASAPRTVRAFPEDARARAGHEIFRVQLGGQPTDWKPIPNVGEGACEIRIRTDLQHRVIDVARFAEAIYVLHAFEKKTQQTTRADVGIAAARYRELLRSRPAVPARE